MSSEPRHERQLRSVRITPDRLRRFMNWWPPYLGAGIRIEHIAQDWSSATVALTLRWYNRNIRGTHFGGSIYSMADPFYALLVMHRLGADYNVWDKAASVEFIAPGRGRIRARYDVAEHDIAQIVRMTADGDKHLHIFRADVVDEEGIVVARVEKIVYVRRRKPVQ